MKPFDRVVVSGYCLSAGRFFYRLPAVVSTVDVAQVKVWPEHTGPERFDYDPSKLWFCLRTLRVHKTLGSML